MLSMLFLKLSINIFFKLSITFFPLESAPNGRNFLFPFTEVIFRRRLRGKNFLFLFLFVISEQGFESWSLAFFFHFIIHNFSNWPIIEYEEWILKTSIKYLTLKRFFRIHECCCEYLKKLFRFRLCFSA